MAVGDTAANAGLPVVAGKADLRMGFEDINRLADALVPYVRARIEAERDVSPTLRKISASNIPAGLPDASGPTVSVQTFLTDMFNRNSQNIGALGPNNENTSIQSYLNLLNQAVRDLQAKTGTPANSATVTTFPEES